uniref:Uncharacterized protein n=1 Tax=Pipistrellus kuhlii TaxID=59472 RepID=A0A7J8A7P0_PIPKU|nr:hypothetical protein mPipKuh1_008803 [Pipistrellus kuhlii]
MLGGRCLVRSRWQGLLSHFGEALGEGGDDGGTGGAVHQNPRVLLAPIFLLVPSPRTISDKPQAQVRPLPGKEAAGHAEALNGSRKDDRGAIGGGGGLCPTGRQCPTHFIPQGPVPTLLPRPDSIAQLTAGSSGLPQQGEQQEAADTCIPRQIHLLSQPLSQEEG